MSDLKRKEYFPRINGHDMVIHAYDNGIIEAWISDVKLDFTRSKTQDLFIKIWEPLMEEMRTKEEEAHSHAEKLLEDATKEH